MEKPGVISPDGKKIDVSAFGEDYTLNFFASNGLTRLEKWLENYGTSCPAVEDSERLG
ncbi:MAG: ureidoglycolate lyase, partial [Leptolyngbya sp. SIO3F4]|nr:ureidoglycolate lyase [Leptolyngbya sp. SIO3F4]